MNTHEAFSSVLARGARRRGGGVGPGAVSIAADHHGRALSAGGYRRPHRAAGGCCHGEGAEESGRGAEQDGRAVRRSEEHTSELQSLTNLVCRLLLEKKNTMARAEVSEGKS